MKLDFTTIDKQKVIVLDNEIGLQVYLVNIGASVWKIVFDGKVMNGVPDNFKDYFDGGCYYGKTVGPIANRIKDGKVIINNKEYQMEQNEGNNTLHSGSYGLSNYKFSYNGTIKTDKLWAVNYVLKTKKLKNGLPGNVSYQVTYALYAKENKLTILFSAISDEDTAMSMTNHLYFSLGDEDLSEMNLTIPANRFVNTEKDTLIPIEVKNVPKCLDFQKSKKIMKDIDDPFIKDHRSNGYDHCFILNSKDPVILENKNYKLSITSDFDSVQIYSDNYETPYNILTSTKKLHRSVAIEPEDNILELHILKKNEQYSKQIDYVFEKKN